MKDPRPNYDYLLVVGPGRSGTDFLYQNLKGHPQFAFPEIKEAGYYRSARRFRKDYGRLRRNGAHPDPAGGDARILADISNLAYQDPALCDHVSRLKSEGVRVLVVVLLREHCDRARSMYRYRKSRGHLSAWLGAGRLERAVVRDRLTPEQMEEIYRAGVDVLCLDFAALMRQPEAAFQNLGGLCGVNGFGQVATEVSNPSVRGRSLPLSAAAHAGAALLRVMGLRRLLQRLKDSRRIDRLFFVAMPEEERHIALKAENLRLLETAFAGCMSTIKAHSEPMADGAYIRKAD